MKTNLRWTTDLLDQQTGDPQLFVYDAYLHYRHRRYGEALLGRQFVYGGVGSELLDGLRVRLGLTPRTELNLFGGSSVDMLDPERVRSFGEFSVLGAQLSHQPLTSMRFGLSWMRRTGEGQVSFHRVGLDGRYSIRRWALFGRVNGNLIDRSLATLQFRLSHRFRPWFVSGEYLSREPAVSGNSLFSLIDAYSWRQVRLVLERSLPHRLTLTTQVQIGLFEGDNSYRFGLGVFSGLWRVDWFHQNGRGGDNNSLRASVTVESIWGWSCYAGANIGRYRVQSEQEGHSDAHALMLGLSRRVAGRYDVRLEGQLLRNAVQSHDARVYLRVSRDFALGGGGER